MLIVSKGSYAVERCKITEKALVGAWVLHGGAGFFQEMAFSIEGYSHQFNSWLHHRPEIINAAWEMKDCKLTIKPANDMDDFNYTVINVKKNRLVLRENKHISQYRRVE